MSVKIIIGSSERSIQDIEPDWIENQIVKRRQEGVPICIKVYIDKPSINIALSTSDCPPSSSSKREPNAEEKEIFDLWRRLKLNDATISPGNLIAFLKQI